MSTPHTQIFAICEQLVANGKKPSVALIKSRLSTPIALPTIVSALSAFKKGQPLESKEAALQQAPQTSLTQRVDDLERQVGELTAKLDALIRSSS